MFSRGYLIRWSWLSVFISGNCCTIEIDIRLNGVTYTHQFFTRNGFHNYFSNKVIVYRVDNNMSKGSNINTYI